MGASCPHPHIYSKAYEAKQLVTGTDGGDSDSDSDDQTDSDDDDHPTPRAAAAGAPTAAAAAAPSPPLQRRLLQQQAASRPAGS
eukprot:gene32785-29023_t